MSDDIIQQMDAPPPAPPRREPGWGYTEIALVIAVFILSLLACGIVGVAVARTLPLFQGLSSQQIATSPLLFVPVQAAAYLLTFLVVRLVVVSRSGEAFAKAIRWELPAGERVVFYILIGVLLAVSMQFFSAFLPMPKSLPMQQYFREARFAYVMMAFGLLVAPLAEELFFRGLLFPVLVRTMGRFASIVVTGACFSLMHQGQLARACAPLMLLFAVGVVLTVIRDRANSVAASWITHLAYNGTLFASLFFLSSGFRNLAR